MAKYFSIFKLFIFLFYLCVSFPYLLSTSFSHLSFLSFLFISSPYLSFTPYLTSPSLSSPTLLSLSLLLISSPYLPPYLSFSYLFLISLSNLSFLSLFHIFASHLYFSSLLLIFFNFGLRHSIQTLALEASINLCIG